MRSPALSRHRARPGTVLPGVLWMLLCGSLQAEDRRLVAESPVYVRRDGLEETLLASRDALRAALSRQGTASERVRAGPWFLAERSLSREAWSEGNVDPTSRMPDGRPSWMARPDWKDGRVLDLPAAPAVLYRVLRASEPVTILAGVGGGDRLSLLLNGEPVLSAETRLAYGRYGVSHRLDGTRVDQVVCGLPLRRGENRLVLELHQDSDGPRQLCFSLDPEPAPFVWREVEKDFPRSAHRLLAEVRFDWFEASGWLARDDATLERRFLERILEEQGSRAAALERALSLLQDAGAPCEDPRWLELCGTAAQLHTMLQGLDRLRASVEFLTGAHPEEYPGPQFLERLALLERRVLQQAEGGLDPDDPDTRELAEELQRSREEMLVDAHPRLRGRDILFIRRYTYDSQHFYDDFYHGVRGYGGSISRLCLEDGTVTDVVPRLSGGVFDRFDLSPDGRRIVFGYRPPRPEGFRIWEAGIDGGEPRQLTCEPEDEDERMARYSLYSRAALEQHPILHGHWTDDMHPAYLPDGDVVFASSRCERTAVCGDHRLPTTVLYRIQPDGSSMQRLSQGMLSEFTPTVLHDGRILYTRWEYVFKGIAAIQPLWAMRPDGSAQEEVYGNNIRDPGVLYQARQVPGHPYLVVCTGCGHEPLAVGTVLLLDLSRDKRTPSVLRRLTPETDVRGLRGLYQYRNGRWQADDLYGPFYCDPFPLSESYFLVSCNPDGRYNDPSAYGLYLLDVFGNLVPIHHDPGMSCFVPTLLAPRPKPPVLPSSTEPGAVAESPRRSPSNRPAGGEGTLVLQDVYRGLNGVRRGEVKMLRIWRQVPRPWAVWPCSGHDSFPGQMVAVSWYSHIWVTVLEGIVPVHEDGSACFTVPADCNLYFEALDEDFVEVQRMRTFVNLRPGETRSCIGCHEPRGEAPAHRATPSPLALRSPPARPGPPPGCRGPGRTALRAPRPVHYETDVQPILDRHCISCHGGKEPAGELALTGEPTTHFNRSYEQLMSRGLISTVREWTSPPGGGSSWEWSMAHAPPIAPRSVGSSRSRLVRLFQKGHHDVELSRPEWVRLLTWIDSNGQYYGSYFGTRHIRFQSLAGFRPAPTLDSARGIRPGDVRSGSLAAIPAELLARWALQEGEGTLARDSGGGAHHGEIVGATWQQDARGTSLRFSGDASYVRIGDLPGDFTTLSVAFRVRCDSHPNTWNPVLFCDTWSERDVHLSLLESGAVNVALHDGTPGGRHHASASAVGDGKWHHVAVVLDQRAGGSIRFFIDGDLDRTHHLVGPELPLRLEGVRLGGYDVWEKLPGRNFRGSLADIRIYRGMLTGKEVAELASAEVGS